MTTLPGFGGQAAITILGNGALSYRDDNASPLMNYVTGYALNIESNGDVGGTPGSVTIFTGGNIAGARGGILTENRGTGSTSITATGMVAGNDFYNGIQAVNGAAAKNLTINAAEVNGAGRGISARNDGTGFTTIVATGNVIGGLAEAVWASAGAATTADPATGNNLAVAIQNASGPIGVWTENYGKAGTSITAKGLVNGYDWGIVGYNAASAKGLTIGAANVYSDNGMGIVAQNLGTGKTVITTTGAVFGNSYGIVASSANDLTITTGDVASYNIAIEATSTDTGVVSVTTNGKVGGAVHGIVAQNTGSGTDLSITTLDTVAGGTWGISAKNLGAGATSITTKGLVAAGDTGVLAMNSSLNSKDLTVNVADVTAGAIGVFAVNQGTGNTRVAVDGIVTGQTGAGIVAAGRAGTTEVVNRGLIEGQQAAVSVDSGSALGSLVHNTASGTLRNISGLSSSLAVAFNGIFAAPTTLTNDGSILGTVLVTNAAARFTNNGSWNSIGGVSNFGGNAGSQMVNANAGTIVAGMNAGVAETTQFANLPQFINQGLVTLADGGVGDVIRTSGNVRFAADSSLAVDFGGGGADLLHAGGSADITGGTLIVKPTSTMAVGERYKVVTADGGVTGSFASVNGGNIFLVFKDTYDANDVWLEFVRYRTFVEFGQTPNQISTALGLATTRSGPLFDALMGMSGEAALRNALDQLSGEVHPSARTALMEDSRFVRDGVISRLRSAFDAPGAAPMPVMSYAPGGPILAPGAPPELFSIWGQTYGSWGSFNGNGNAATLNRTLGGLTTGIDTPIFGTVGMPVRVGVMTGYSQTNFSVGERSSSGASSNYHLGAYAGTQIGGFGLRAGVAHTWHDIHTSRFLNFGNFSNLLSADYHGRTTQVFGDLGYKIGFGALQLEPFAGLSYDSLTTSAFREIGGVAALANAGTRSSQTFSTLGTRGSMVFDVTNMATTLRGTLGWRHAFNDVTPGSTFAFSGGVPFNISGIAIARDAAVVEAGMDVAIGAGATLGISYTGQYANSARDHSIKGNLTVKF